MFKSRQQLGFSLLELLVVLALVSMVAALVAPWLTGTLDSLALESVTQDMARSLRSTRIEAIRSGQSATWSIDLEQNRYQRATQPEQTFDKTIAVELTTVASEQVSEQLGRVRFFADGSATGGEVMLSRGQLQYRIQIDWLTGRVVIYEQQA